MQIFDSFTAANPHVRFERVYSDEIISSSTIQPSSYDISDNIILTSISAWKEYAKHPQNPKLDIIVSRNNILADAVKAYKNFEKIPKMIPRNVLFRTITVTFKDEEGLDAGGLTAEFFTLFFSEMIANSGLFATNSEGSLIFAEGIELTENVMDLYEAFGFYLAKAYQIDHPIGCGFADILIKMIKNGKLTDLKVKDLESYDKSLVIGLNAMLQLSDEVLADFNFKDISDKFVSTPVTAKNVKSFVDVKSRDYYQKKFQAQMLMLTLGFVRGCPGGLIAKESAISVKNSISGSASSSYSVDEFIAACKMDQCHEHPDLHSAFFIWLSEPEYSKKMVLLRFLTGLNCVPFGGLKAISPPLRIKVQGSKDLLPSANSCGHILFLPAYETPEQLISKFDRLIELIENNEALHYGFQ